jgi:hypothetical protein
MVSFLSSEQISTDQAGGHQGSSGLDELDERVSVFGGTISPNTSFRWVFRGHIKSFLWR